MIIRFFIIIRLVLISIKYCKLILIKLYKSSLQFYAADCLIFLQGQNSFTVSVKLIKILSYVVVSAPLAIRVLPVLTISTIPYFSNIFFAASILSDFPDISNETVVSLISIISPLKASIS